VLFLFAMMVAGLVLGTVHVSRPTARLLDGVRHVREGDFRTRVQPGRDDPDRAARRPAPSRPRTTRPTRRRPRRPPVRFIRRSPTAFRSRPRPHASPATDRDKRARRRSGPTPDGLRPRPARRPASTKARSSSSAARRRWGR
jgi:hypothetical protein